MDIGGHIGVADVSCHTVIETARRFMLKLVAKNGWYDSGITVSFQILSKAAHLRARAEKLHIRQQVWDREGGTSHHVLFLYFETFIRSILMRKIDP